MSHADDESQHTWFDPSEFGPLAAPVQDTSFARLWLGLVNARVWVASILLLLQVLLSIFMPAGTPWSLWLIAAYLAAVVFTKWKTVIALQGPAFERQWQLTIGLDILVFALLQWINPQSINYTPLLALPVLVTAVMGSLTMALATASIVTLYLLGLVWPSARHSTQEFVPGFFQAGLTGIGFFGVALLAHQVANRLLREAELTHRSQEATKLQTQVNELVIEGLSHGVIVVDLQGTVHAANPASRRLLSPQRRRVSVPFDLSDEPGWQALGLITSTTFFLKSSQSKDLGIAHQGEPSRRVHVRTQLTSHEDHGAESLCVAFIEDLPELEAKLRQEKMIAMGRMSAAVAHEIRNPLAAITQANALLAEDLTTPGQQRLTTMIEQNAKRLDRIVEDVLNLARVPRHSEDLAPSLNLDETVERFARDWCQQNRREKKTHLSLGADGYTVSFDAEHLRRVLVNLLDNAARYSGDEQDSIIVSTHLSANAATNRPQTLGSLRVWSDGLPLDPTVRRHLFEPFFSSESRSSGLGLYICRELCERHGASLSYNREPSRAGLRKMDGNCFYIEFTLKRVIAPIEPDVRIT